MIDADGYLTITDRVKDIIIRGGENVSAAEVEQLLAHMKGVAEVAVVAAPDERLGEHGCAFFRMQPGSEAPDMDALRAHLQEAGLTRQKWPEEIRDRRRTAADALGEDPEVRAAAAPARRAAERAERTASRKSCARRMGEIRSNRHCRSPEPSTGGHMRSRIPKQQIDLLEGRPALLRVLAERAREPSRSSARRSASRAASFLTEEGSVGREFFLVLAGIASCRVGKRSDRGFTTGGLLRRAGAAPRRDPHGGRRRGDARWSCWSSTPGSSARC